MEKFSISSKGTFLDNLSEAQVLANLSHSFKTPVEQVRSLLVAGKVLKTNLSSSLAQRYLQGLQQAGLGVKSTLQTSHTLFSDSLVSCQQEGVVSFRCIAKLLPNQQLGIVRQALVKHFQLNEVELNDFFKGSHCFERDDIDDFTVQHYQQLFNQIGLVTQVASLDTKPSTEKLVAEDQSLCPRCSTEKTDLELCTQCGIYFAKYEAQQRRQQEPKIEPSINEEAIVSGQNVSPEQDHKIFNWKYWLGGGIILFVVLSNWTSVNLYKNTATITNIFHSIMPIKVSVMEYFVDRGEFPIQLEDMGMNSAEMKTKDIQNIRIGEQGRIIIQFSEALGEDVYMILTPKNVMGGFGGMEWTCKSNYPHHKSHGCQ